MAAGYSHIPGDLDAVQNDRNQSETTIRLPPAPTAERVSAYYPEKDLRVLEDPNLDPFYLEQSLPDTVPLDSNQSNVSDASGGPEQYFMLPTSTAGRTSSCGSVSRNSVKTQPSNQPTPSALEIEHGLGFQEYAHYFEDARFSSGESFSSTQSESTPDLSPSSSLSSYCSPSLPLKATIRGTELLWEHIKGPKAGSQSDCCSYPPHQHIAAPRTSSSPAQSTMAEGRRAPKPLETANPPQLWKPLPSLPKAESRNSSHSGKKRSSDSGRPQIERSMISPPSLLNPVTLEPHQTHFDQALFIPATEYPSPAPSPTTRSPLAERDVNIVPRAPSISSFDPYFERSAWESDSDTESISRKSLSRKTNDTLRKVRSRAKLRVAKSVPKLNAAKQEDLNVELSPPVPNPWQEVFRKCSTTSLHRPSSRWIFRAPEQETLRLVAPSTTSLPPASSQKNSTRGKSDMDPSTAAAMQAQSRRRQRVTPEPFSLELEPHLSFCRRESSDDSIDDDKAQTRDPLFKRIWRSLHVWGCRAGLPENGAVRPF